MKLFTKILYLIFFSIILLIGVSIGAVVYFFNHDIIDIHKTNVEDNNYPSILLDDNDHEYGRFELDRRTPVSINTIPFVVVQAFLAAEDHGFFTHHGLSWRGIIRSTLVNLYHGKVVQGASTITQQVARLQYLSHERTWKRKAKEVLIALQLEQRLTKSQILEKYLNNMYFGHGIYGIEAACQRFWNKSVMHVSLDESAVLAAIAKSSRYYSPLNAPLSARKRRNTILHSMYKMGFITKEIYHETTELPLIVENAIPGNPMRLYIQEWIRMWVERTWGRDALYTQGLKIKTTINLNVQEAAEKSFHNMVSSQRKRFGPSFNGGLVSLDVTSGKVKAAIGGLNFKESQFNRSFKAYRQLGSSFKPLIYALALMSGYDMDYIMIDEPVKISGNSNWKPRNWTNIYEGPMTLARALVKSNNMIAINLGMLLGLERVINLAQQCGITRSLDPYPSFSLGTAHGSPEENAAAFNIFANNGVFVGPFLVEWVKDKSGKKIWEHQPISRRILDKRANAKMVKVLSHRMNVIQKKGTTLLACEAIGKTGSTNNAATMWFVGSTPTLTTAVYLGRDDNKPLGKHAYATLTAFPLWLNMNEQVGSPVSTFYLDPSLQEEPIDWWTGERIDKSDENAITILK